MIQGSQKKKIERFKLIDHFSEGLSWTEPESNESFLGVPYQFDADDSMPYVEIYRDGSLVKTVNAMDCSEIEFRNG